MKIWFNLAISAVIAIVVAVSLASAKNVLQKPIVDNLQSRPDKLSVKHSSNIQSTKSYIDNVEKTVDTTMAMSPSNTAAVSSSADISSEIYTSNNISAIASVEDTTIYTSFEDTNKAQATKIANVKTLTEDKMILKFQKINTIYLSTTHNPKMRYSHGRNSIIRFREFTCPDGQTKNTNGECEPIFSD